MNKSENIDQLATALSKFQGEVKDTFKDKKGYGYKYADLSQVLEITRPLMSKNGLSIVQFPGTDNEKITLESMLMHTSGQWLSHVLEMNFEKGKLSSTAQAIGSIITYARRYSITSILGIAQTDNDASIIDHENSENVINLELQNKISEKDVENIMNVLNNDEERIMKLLKWAGVDKIQNMNVGKYHQAISMLKGNGNGESKCH